MKVSIVLPSFNKGEYALEAIESVVSQTYQDWELWLLENSTDGTTRNLIEDSGLINDSRIIYEKIDMTGLRQSVYPAAWLVNKYYPQVSGDLILFLADDDLLNPECLSICVNHFMRNPSHYAAYFGLQLTGVEWPREPPIEVCGTAEADIIRTSGMLQGKVDGGQVMHRKNCLYYMDQPYAPDAINDKTFASDGILLENIAKYFSFHPIHEILATHRFTPESNWVGYVKAYGGRCKYDGMWYRWMND